MVRGVEQGVAWHKAQPAKDEQADDQLMAQAAGADDCQLAVPQSAQCAAHQSVVTANGWFLMSYP
jgi:hypothetical protein